MIDLIYNVLILLQNVWSDNEAVIQEMQKIQDYAESCGDKSITDILEYINTQLAKVQFWSCATQSNEVRGLLGLICML